MTTQTQIAVTVERRGPGWYGYGIAESGAVAFEALKAGDAADWYVVASGDDDTTEIVEALAYAETMARVTGSVGATSSRSEVR